MVSRRSHKNFLIVLVKSPVLGEVKTRLWPMLTQQQSVCVYRAFVVDFLKRIAKCSGFKKTVAYSGYFKYLAPLIPSGFDVVEQGEGSLGDRMIRMFNWSERQNAERTVMIGSDSPTLPVESLQRAFQILYRKEVVLGPAWDGGFYLIGARNPFQSEFFEGVEWSTRWTLIQTLSQIKKHRKKLGILFPWYDIDQAKDIHLLYSEFLQSPFLRKKLKKTYSETLSLLKVGADFGMKLV